MPNSMGLKQHTKAYWMVTAQKTHQHYKAYHQGKNRDISKNENDIKMHFNGDRKVYVK